VPLDGGPAQTLFQEKRPLNGMAVGVDGRVVFNRELSGIWQFTVGSAPTAVTALAKGELVHALPQLVANDAVLLFTVRPSFSTWGHERVEAQVLATGERKLILRDAADARYVSSGHLLFLRRGLLMAAPFDLTRLAVTGPPVAVLDGVAQSLTEGNTGDITGGGQFSVSTTGALAYIPSPVVPVPNAALVMVDRRGHARPLAGELRDYGLPRVSPDGHRLAVVIRTLTENALWVLDLARGSFTKLIAEGEVMFPRWTPDGQRIAFHYTRDGVSQLAWQSADDSAGPDTLVEGGVFASSWSPDGRHLATLNGSDIWVLTVGDRPPSYSPLAVTPEEERDPEFSPDGRSLAYTSNKTGRWEVYVRHYPGSGPSIPVSTTGGYNPAWNPKGGELFFLSGTHVMAVAMVGRQPGTPRPLFESRGSCEPVRCYDVMSDGQHFVFARAVPRDPAPPVTHINLVQNWVEELKGRVPVRGAK
jgi:eukaryotic-like serine/threonine-protein kinase